MKKLNYLTLMVATLFSVTLYTGCSDDPSDPGTVTIVVPAKGSIFTYTEYDLDDQGAKDPSTEFGVVATVEETDVSINGKTGVVKAVEVPDDGSENDTVYLKYESNNDVSFFTGLDDINEEVDALWLTMPFGSKTKKTETINETIDDGMGGTATINLTITTEWVRSEKATIQGTEMDVWVADLIISGTIPVPLVGAIPVNATSTFHFVPQLGYVYRQDGEATIPGFGTTKTVRLLVSYTLA